MKAVKNDINMKAESVSERFIKQQPIINDYKNDGNEYIMPSLYNLHLYKGITSETFVECDEDNCNSLATDHYYTTNHPIILVNSKM